MAILLEDKFKLELRIRELQQLLPSLDLISRCEAEDEILSIKEQLGNFKRQTENNNDECINCSG